MNLPSDTPRLPKLIFLIGEAALLTTAWFVYTSSEHPSTTLALAVSALVVIAAVLGVVPFMADYAHRQDEALDNRQRSLQSLAATVASISEQVSIAATGLQGISEAAQDNFGKSEKLSRQIEEKIAQLDARLAGAKREDSEAAAKLEAATRKMAELDARLAEASRHEDEAAAKLDSISRKITKAASDFEAAVARAVEAAKAVPAAPMVVPEVPKFIPEVPPVIASRIVEIKPAVLSSSPPFEAPAAPSHAAEITPTPQPQPPPAQEPAAQTDGPPETAAAPEPPRPPPRKRSPRKAVPPPEAPAPDLVLEPTQAADTLTPAAPDVSEPAVSADGATRLLVTAYIGIGNRLFIRGDGPGLSWEKGVPLTFVSIGKWRWETNDASAPVSFKLYKNDDSECASLGRRTVEPGAQQELTASF